MIDVNANVSIIYARSHTIDDGKVAVLSPYAHSVDQEVSLVPGDLNVAGDLSEVREARREGVLTGWSSSCHPTADPRSYCWDMMVDLL